MIKAVVFDVDGVLVPIKSSWDYFHTEFGTLKDAERNYQLYLNGKITYYEWLILDVASWLRKRGKIHISEINEIARKITPIPEAYTVFKKLRERGIKTALLSAGIDVVVRRIAGLLEADFWIANALEYDAYGYLVPDGIPCVPGGRKDVALPIVEDALRVNRNNMMFVGDSTWDVSVMKQVACPIAYGNDEHVVLYAKKRISNLLEILEIIKNNTICSS